MMEIFTKIDEIRAFCHNLKMQDRSIGFVPTMGALHEGHLQLVGQCQVDNEITICSIFVNPMQFNNPEDLENYPRNTDTDLDSLRSISCHAVFCPDDKELYPSQPLINFSFGYLENVMEGKYRPGHFKGVGLVVCKLLNIIEPDRAYFGQKDIQQLTIVKRMVSELNFNTEIVAVPTVREPDGLAISSRNQLLTASQRDKAIDLYNALLTAKQKLISGMSVISVKTEVEMFFKNSSDIKLEYFEIVRLKDLHTVANISGDDKILMCIAGYLGKVRLIDNLSLN
jgi:pantoate--beta-alanine ligase